MSDIRPFVIRRSIGGDTLRPTTGFKGALRFGPEDVAFDAVKGTTLDGIPVGYDTTTVTVQVPASVPNRGQMVLVRGGFGYPTTPLDGVQVWSNPDNLGLVVTTQFNQQVRDTPLTGGRWYYYTLFVNVVTLPYPVLGSWQTAAHASVLVPRDYQHSEKLFSLIPPFYQGQDDRQAADGRNGPLRKFIRTIGYDADYNRTLLDGVLNTYSPDFAPLPFTQQVGVNLGLDTEDAIGGARFRTLVGRIWDLDAARGTGPGLQQFIYAASNYRTVVLPGVNMLLTPDDAEFITGVGHWKPYANPHVVDMTDVPPVPDTHPPATSISRMIVRKYTGGVILPPAGFGQGIMEIIELTTTITPGKYGTPGTITGAVTSYANLAALTGASPAPVVGTVANYYTNTAAAWWAGDYVVLGDASHAYWNGTTWVAGNAVLARPAITGYAVGAPGYATPFGANPDATSPSTGVLPAALNPPVEWKSGDYVVMQNGTFFHPRWRNFLSPTLSIPNRVLEWTTGPGVLSIPATSGLRGNSNKVAAWQLSDGSFAYPSIDLAGLQAINVVGLSETAPLDSPWNPANSYELIYTYNNTRVSWLGRSYVMSAVTPPATRAVAQPVDVDTADTASTGADVWADSAVAAGATATTKLLTYESIASGYTVHSISLPSGWQPLFWPNNTASQSGTAWTDVGGTHDRWSPAATVDVRFHCMIHGQGTGSNILAGTILALYINGVEHSRVQLDIDRQFIEHMAYLNVLSTDVCQYQVWSPTAQTIGTYAGGGGNTDNIHPFWRIIARPAIVATGGSWAPATAGRYYVGAALTPYADPSKALNDLWLPQYTDMKPFFIMKTGKIVATGWMGTGQSQIYSVGTFVDMLTTDRVYIVVPPNYPTATAMNITYLGVTSPRLTVARWKAA